MIVTVHITRAVGPFDWPDRGPVQAWEIRLRFDSHLVNGSLIVETDQLAALAGLGIGFTADPSVSIPTAVQTAIIDRLRAGQPALTDHESGN